MFLAASAFADSTIKAVIFDMGGVVLESKKVNKVEFLSKNLGIPAATIKKNFKKKAKQLSKGAVDEDQFWKTYVSANSGKLPEGWIQKWEDFYRDSTVAREEVLAVVKKLRGKGYLTPMLSNTTASNARVNRARGLLQYFSPLFLSFEIHKMKPDPRAYQYALDRIKFKPQECVFIDDQLRNIDAANKLGIHGIQFKGTADLVGKLKALGVRVE